MTILAVPISAMFENRNWLALPWDSKLFCTLKLFVSVLIVSHDNKLVNSWYNVHGKCKFCTCMYDLYPWACVLTTTSLNVLFLFSWIPSSLLTSLHVFPYFTLLYSNNDFQSAMFQSNNPSHFYSTEYFGHCNITMATFEKMSDGSYIIKPIKQKQMVCCTLLVNFNSTEKLLFTLYGIK